MSIILPKGVVHSKFSDCALVSLISLKTFLY